MPGFYKSKWTWILILSICAALWMRTQKSYRVCKSKTDLTGKTVVITGGNSGVGFQTAVEIAKRNANLIIACRNEHKAKKAAEEIRKTTGTMSVKYVIVDFAEMADIRRAADVIMQNEECLDILINNAGVFTYGKTKDGLDNMFGVNHLGYFMFTNLLMPLMRKTAKTNPVRIINVSSGAYADGKIDFDHLNPNLSTDSGMSDVMQQYASTKLMNLYFTIELDIRLKREYYGEKQAITTYSLHPGMIHSNIGKDYVDTTSIWMKMIWNIFRMLSTQPAAQSAQTTTCCAVHKGIEKYSGRFFSDLQLVEIEECARDPDIRRKLWVTSEQISGVYWGNRTVDT